MLVSPFRNHSSSWMIERRCSFLVVTSGKPGQVEAHLPAEHAAGAGAGAVGLLGAVLEYVAKKIQVLLHFAASAAGCGISVGEECDFQHQYRPSRIKGRLST